MQEELSTYGWARGAPGNSFVFLNILDLLGIKDKLPKTKSGEVSTAKGYLSEYITLPFINLFLKYKKLETASTFIRNLKENVVHGRFNLLMRTGRVSMSAPNLQQLPRSGGIRECFIPKKEGNKFFIVDYSNMESCMLGQVLIDKYGESELARVLNDGLDVHRFYASSLYSKPMEDVTKEERQSAKMAVFGLPGGLGKSSFKTFAKGHGVDLTDQECYTMMGTFFNTFPKVKKYLDDCKEGPVVTKSGRIRVDATYNAVANTPFQGMGADMSKIALYNLTKAGFHIVAFIHDEIIVESSGGDKEFNKMKSIMVDAGKELSPDVRITVDGEIKERWEKI